MKMFCSTYLMVFLLMNIVPMASSIVKPKGCNMDRKPNINVVDVYRLKGTWYARSITGYLPRFAKLTSYVLQIDFNKTDDQTRLIMTSRMSFNDQKNCSEFKSICNLKESTCTATRFEHVYQIIALDYNSAFALWSEYVEDGETYKILSIFAKDAIAAPEMKNLRSNLQTFCGAKAVDPTSDFYVKKYSYQNSPCLV